MRCKLWIQTNFCPDDYPVIPISFIELFIFPYYECEMLHLSYLKSHENMALYLGSLSISLVYALMHQDNTILITRGLCFTIRGIGPVSFSPFFSPTIFFSCSCLFHMSFKKKSFNTMDPSKTLPNSVFSLKDCTFNHSMCHCSFNLILYLIQIYFLLPVVLFLYSTCQCSNR